MITRLEFPVVENGFGDIVLNKTYGGRAVCTSIVPIERNGVPTSWFAVEFSDGTKKEVNAAHVAVVTFSSPDEAKP